MPGLELIDQLDSGAAPDPAFDLRRTVTFDFIPRVARL